MNTYPGVIAMHGLQSTGVALGTLAVSAGLAVGAVIRPSASSFDVVAGTTVRVLYLVEGPLEPLLGYSLAISPARGLVSGITPEAIVTVDATQTSFFHSRNVITAAGKEHDPRFSVIRSDSVGGVFLSTITSDFAPVDVQANVNDVLAELVFTVGTQASGRFDFTIGPSTALSNSNGESMPFSGEVFTVNVIPSPGWTSPVLMGMTLARSRRRVASR